MKLHHQRKQYFLKSLTDSDVPDNPLLLFAVWYQEAVEASHHEANAMVLSTVTDNKPSSRVVLLKEFGEMGFVFFSNYHSRKGNELSMNPMGSLLFYWPELERQVRIEGKVCRVPEEESEAYFDSRPAESRISAIISPQSKVIASREQLLNSKSEFIHQQLPLKKPLHWGGYRLEADCIEFWQGQADRLHDRIQYLRQNEKWMHQRLAP